MINQAMFQANPSLASLFGTARASGTRKRRKKAGTKHANGSSRPKKKRAAKRANGKGKRLVKGSAAAKAWGAKMRRARKRK